MIHLGSSDSDSDGWNALLEEEQWVEGKIGPAKRRRVERKIKSEAKKLLPDGFLDPLPPPTPFKIPTLSRSRLGAEATEASSCTSYRRKHDLRGNTQERPWHRRRKAWWPETIGKNDILGHAEPDAERWFLLKQLQDHNGHKWRRQDMWLKGAWERIVQAFNNRFPNRNATKAQLQDRLYLMKKNYKVLKNLSELNGLRWDPTNNMLQGSEEVWQTLLHSNRDAKKWYNTSWPYYSIFEELFGGKCADEKQSSGADHSEEKVNANQPLSPLPTTPTLGETSQQFDGLQEPEEVGETLVDSPSTRAPPRPPHRPSQASSCSFTTSRAKSRAMPKFIKEFTDMRGESREAVGLRHDERDFSIKTCMEAFYKLDGFTREDLLKVVKVFKIVENREIFLSLRDEDKEFWLRKEVDAL